MATKESQTIEEKEEECVNNVRLNMLISNLGMRTLRLLFRDRYNSLTDMDWENGSVPLARDYLETVESSIALTSEGKLALETADINKWDYTLLANALCEMSATRLGLTNEEKEAEDEAVKMFLSTRRYVEHLKEAHDRGVPNNDFERTWQSFRDSLLRLGAREKDIEHLYTSSNLMDLNFNTAAAVDPEMECRSKVLRGQAKELITAGKFQRGIQLYSEALLLTSGISNEEKSYIYSGRSQAYINQLEDRMKSLADDAVQECLDAAMEDATLVVQLQPEWWEGYFLQGKCFQLQKLLKEALDSFEVALTLNPNSEEALNARSECRLDLSQSDSEDGPGESNKLSHTFKTRKDIKLIMKINKEFMRSDDPGERGDGCLFMGHRYLIGDEVPLNEKKATELFKSAAEVGNPAGALCAGLNYITGVGVKRSIPEALKYLEAAANHQVNLKPSMELEELQQTVAKAQEVLGSLYQRGVGKTRNYILAKEWYTRAALVGYDRAAARLGTMYADGLGIPRDMKRALQYQELAVGQGSDASFMKTLAWLYAEVGDHPHARYWYGRAISSGYPLFLAFSERVGFDGLIQRQELKFDKLRKKLPDHVWNSGVPIHILCDRYFKRLIGNGWSGILKLHRNDLDVPSSSTLSNYLDSLSLRAKQGINFEEVKKLAENGEEHAGILLGALGQLHSGVQAIKLLLSIDRNKLTPTEEEVLKKLPLAQVAACFTAQMGFVVSLTDDCLGKLLEIAVEFTSDQERSDADLQARICRLNLSMKSLEEAVEFAGVCKGLYPEEAHFHYVDAYMLGNLKKYREGLKTVEESLKLFPKNWELLFLRAQYLNRLWQPDLSNCDFRGFEDYFSREPLPNENELILESLIKWLQIEFDYKFNREIQAFEDFIREAPAGHPRIPEAYYCIAMIYAFQGKNEIEKYYLLGMEAEKKLLSNFLPYGSSSKKLSGQCLKLNEGIRSRDILDHLMEEDQEEREENRTLKLTSPKRIVTVKDFRKRFLGFEVGRSQRKLLDRIVVPSNLEGVESERPLSRQEITHLKDIRFEDIDPTLDHVYKGHLLNLTIMDEYLSGIMNSIATVVKDDNDDFNIICFDGFDRSHPSTKKKLGFGSRIQVINPRRRQLHDGQTTMVVHDPKSVIFVSNGDENPICRYCWKPNPGLRCGKCNVAQYCNKECQQLDWAVLGHKDLCKGLCKRQKSTGNRK